MRPPESLAERQAAMRLAQGGGHRRGRPRLPLDALAIFELAQLGLSNRQIATQLGCHHTTLHRFAADLERARLHRRALLQLGQMRLIAEENDWAALQAQLKACRAAGNAGLKPSPCSGEK